MNLVRSEVLSVVFRNLFTSSNGVVPRNVSDLPPAVFQSLQTSGGFPSLYQIKQLEGADAEPPLPPTWQDKSRECRKPGRTSPRRVKQNEFYPAKEGVLPFADVYTRKIVNHLCNDHLQIGEMVTCNAILGT